MICASFFNYLRCCGAKAPRGGACHWNLCTTASRLFASQFARDAQLGRMSIVNQDLVRELKSLQLAYDKKQEQVPP